MRTSRIRVSGPPSARPEAKATATAKLRASAPTIACFYISGLRCVRDDLDFPAVTVAVACRFLPARLAYARDFAVQRHLAEADSADAEFAQECTRPPATTTTVARANLEFRLLLGLFDQCLSCHFALVLPLNPRRLACRGQRLPASRRGTAYPSRAEAQVPHCHGRSWSRTRYPCRGLSGPCRNRSRGRSSVP